MVINGIYLPYPRFWIWLHLRVYKGILLLNRWKKFTVPSHWEGLSHTPITPALPRPTLEETVNKPCLYSSGKPSPPSSLNPNNLLSLAHFICFYNLRHILPFVTNPLSVGLPPWVRPQIPLSYELLNGDDLVFFASASSVALQVTGMCQAHSKHCRNSC